MPIFKRFRIPRVPRTSRQPDPGDCHELSRVGDDPALWDELDEVALRQVLAIKFLEYGTTHEAERIEGLFALYRHAMTRIPPTGRHKMLAEYSTLIERHQGFGHLGLLMFLAADTDPGIRSSAALNLSVLYDPAVRNEDHLAGPRFVIQTLANHDGGGAGQGTALGGVLLLGDKRIMPLLAEVWDGLSEEAQLDMTRARSGLVSEGIIEFWLGRLENGCSEAVFGSAVAAIARMPAVAQEPCVLDIERRLPAYAGGEPMRTLRRTSFAAYLEEIRPRLEALEAGESEPKVIPQIFEIWENPDSFQGIVGESHRVSTI